MFRLKRMNVIAVVDSETKAKKLMKQGFSLVSQPSFVKASEAVTRNPVVVVTSEPPQFVLKDSYTVEELSEMGIAEVIFIAKENECYGEDRTFDDMFADLITLYTDEETNEDDSFDCPHCDKTYKAEPSLRRHIKDKHPEELEAYLEIIKE